MWLTYIQCNILPYKRINLAICSNVNGPREKAMAPHSSTLTWKIPWAEEPGMLQSMGSQRVGHDWVTSLSLFTFMHWRRKWQPTRVLTWRIPETGEPGGLPSMGSHRVGYSWSDLAVAAASLSKGAPWTVLHQRFNGKFSFQWNMKISH